MPRLLNSSSTPLLERREWLTVACTGCLLAACTGPNPGNDSAVVDAVSEPPPDAPAPDSGPDALPDGDVDASLVDAVDAAPESEVMCPPRNSGDLGPISDFPVGSLHRVDSPDGISMMVGRDAAGLWALDTGCPHFNGPLVVTTENTLHCTNVPTANHGANFDGDGRPTRAPGMGWDRGVPLNVAAYKLTVCNGRVYVQLDRVATGTRVPVP